MDVGTNKTRKDTRAVVSLVARYRSPSTFEYVEEACCDVSLGGMFIRSKDPAAAGTLLKLECESGVGAQIRGVARVVWLRGNQSEYGPSGMGVKFVKLDPESRDVIMRIVQELAAEGIESPSMSSAPEHRGKPALSRAPSSTPTAAAPQPRAAELVRELRQSDSQAAPSDAALAHARDSDRAGDVATIPRRSSRPPALPPVSSRPAPNDALLAHATMDSLELSPDRPSMQDIGRDLGPLTPVFRSGRVSSNPPPPDNDRGRAFWLVAGAVVALGAIVAIFSTRGAHEPPPTEEDANVAARPALHAPPPPPALQPTAEPEPAQPSAAEVANAQPNGLGADISAQANPGNQQVGEAALAHDNANDTTQLAPSDNAVMPTAPITPTEVAQLPSATPTAAEPPSKDSRPAAAAAEAAPPVSAPVRQAQSTANPPGPQPSAAPNPPPSAAPIVPEVPVLRISPADPAPPQPNSAQPQATAQPQAQTTPAPSAPSVPPSAAAPSEPNSAQAMQPTAAKPGAAPSSTTPAANVQAPSASVAPPTLAPGEVAHVIQFTSRPIGASVFVGNQSIVTPGEINLGAMPGRVRVTAQKEGFESSTVWINNVAEFQKVAGVMRREVHFVLRSAPSSTAQPSAPSSAPAQPTGSAVAPAQPTAPTQAPSAAPSQPSTPPIPSQP